MNSATLATDSDADAAAWFDAARAGKMPIGTLMERAQGLQQSGAAETAARLYEVWIEHTDSPVRHVACFNRGTLLSSLGRHDAAEAAYRRALALDASLLPARLNLGHLLERQGTVLKKVVMLNRPERLNAWTGRMHHEVRTAMRAAADDEAVRVIVLTGAGRGFCGGPT